MSQGTAHFAYAPQILFDENRSYWRTFHTFETFMLSNWGQIVHDLPAEWRKDKVQGAKMGAYYLSNFFMNAGITYIHTAILASMFGDDDDKEPKGYFDILLSEMVNSIPGMNKLVSAIKYGSNPLVVLQTTDNIINDFRYSIIGVKDETRLIHQIKATAGVLAVLGLPVKYVSEILVKIVKEENNSL
jgi:hypothetical protein